MGRGPSAFRTGFNATCGVFFALFLVVLLPCGGGVFWLLLQPAMEAAKEAARKNEQKAAQKQSTLGEDRKPNVTASLSNFIVDRENAQFVFTVNLKNEEAIENSVYVVVYGKNDMFAPPRRNAWPLAGFIFHEANTDRGRLSPSDISRNWAQRPIDSKGMRAELPPEGTDSIEGALPLNAASTHDAWQGQPLDPRSLYNEAYLWVFSDRGQLVFEQRYNINWTDSSAGDSTQRSSPASEEESDVPPDDSSAIARATKHLPRRWQDKTGQFSVQATLMRREGNIVFIRREDDGEIIQVPLSLLSVRDKQYVASVAPALE